MRTTNLYGVDPDSKNFLIALIPFRSQGDTAKVAINQCATPTTVTELRTVTRELLQAGGEGIFHVSDPDVVNRLEWAHAPARSFGFDRGLIVSVQTEELNQLALRPRRGRLASARLGHPLSALDEGPRAMRRDFERARLPV